MKAVKYGVGIFTLGLAVVFVFGNLLSAGSGDIGVYILIAVLYLCGVLATSIYLILEDRRNNSRKDD